MGKRIGKYKVSNRESTISLVDGGTAEGRLKLSGNTGLEACPGYDYNLSLFLIFKTEDRVFRLLATK